MKLLIFNRKMKFFIVFVVVIFIFFSIQIYQGQMASAEMVMGGRFYIQAIESESENEQKSITNDKIKIDYEKYFRPSDLPILNDKNLNTIIHNNYEKEPSEIILPAGLLETPEDAIINYFSVLREAANYVNGKGAGCGTLGQSKLPYPIAYNFLSSSYKESLTFNQYLKTFENILHINLIKLKEVPVKEEGSKYKRYFVEMETIEGSEKDVAYFAYYYGFINVIKELNQYRISDLEFYGENYLCAPYHGWNYDAESVVGIKYGGWCSLVKEMYPVQQNGFIKRIYFKGTDNNDYLIEFFQLTNDTDIEIAQYMKNENGDWKLIYLNPEKCLEKKQLP